jgi:hypothetical protein
MNFSEIDGEPSAFRISRRAEVDGTAARRSVCQHLPLMEYMSINLAAFGFSQSFSQLLRDSPKKRPNFPD